MGEVGITSSGGTGQGHRARLWRSDHPVRGGRSRRKPAIPDRKVTNGAAFVPILQHGIGKQWRDGLEGRFAVASSGAVDKVRLTDRGFLWFALFWRSPWGKVVQDGLAGIGKDFAEAHHTEPNDAVREH